MNKTLSLNIITPAEALLQANGVKSIRVHLADGGSMGILPDHAPLLGATTAGSVRYVDDLGVKTCELGSGVLQVSNNLVTIFTSGLQDEQLMEAEVNDYASNFARLREALLAKSEPKDDDDT